MVPIRVWLKNINAQKDILGYPFVKFQCVSWDRMDKKTIFKELIVWYNKQVFCAPVAQVDRAVVS